MFSVRSHLSEYPSFNLDIISRLAQRCARILLDINDQMDGRWDNAPSTMIKNLERFQVYVGVLYLRRCLNLFSRTLTSIQEFMKIQTDLKWSDRFLKKSSIEQALAEYTMQLDDAARSFQVCLKQS